MSNHDLDNINSTSSDSENDENNFIEGNSLKINKQIIKIFQYIDFLLLLYFFY